MDADTLRQWIDQSVQAAALAGVQIKPSDLVIDFTTAPHLPPRNMPRDKMAVYMFFHGENCLKIGKAGPKSQARYTSQHYGFNAPSTLARSIFADRESLRLTGLTETDIGPWIKQYLCRANITLDASFGVDILHLLEAFMQCALKPKYEGFAKQFRA